MSIQEPEKSYWKWSIEDFDRMEEQRARAHDAGLVAAELLHETRIGRYLDEEKLRDFDFSTRMKAEWIGRARHTAC